MKENKINISNEEDLKQKVVLPYIESLGFAKNELEYEKNFSIRLGRNVYCINNCKKKENAKGRLDILCKRGDKNLFVIEVKRDNVKITQDDIDQGISYARLLNQIAPFVLITNGKDTITIDTISKKELSGNDIGFQSDFWKNGCKLSSKDELNYRYEALKNFVGYSYENLKLFSKSQIEDRMSVLKGSKNDLTKKYIPELFLKNKKLYCTVEKFLINSDVVFSIIGESGVGKTNHMCYLTENISSKYLTLFFSGANIYKPIIKEIKEDFNWIFSPNLDPNEIFNRLSYLAKTNNTQVIIFIDAIDEIPFQDSINDLSDLCRKVNKYPNIKLCISCKTNEWEKFLEVRGVPSILKESLYKSGQSNDSVSGFKLNTFNDNELEYLNERYKELFKFKGDIKGQLKKDCKLGFMLRVVAEVYSGQELPNTVDDISLLKEFIKRKIKLMKRDDREITRGLLEEIGSIFIEEENKDNKSGKILESKLKKKLGMSLIDKIPEELFSFNILTRNELENGLFDIGFYYTKLRDFIVAIYSLKLPSKDGDEFKKLLSDMTKGPIGISALRWYISKSTMSQKSIMFEYKKSQALLLVKEWEFLIEKNFPNIKDRFEPKTNGEIGIVISNSKNPFIEAFGFRKISNEEEKVVSVEKSNRGENFFAKGVNLVTYFTSHVDPQEKAKKFVMDQLNKIVKKGLLNEDYNINILKEKILSILYYYGNELNIDKPNDRCLPRYNSILPIDLEEIKRRIKIFNAKYYYKQLQFNELKKSGKIEEIKNDNSAFITHKHNNSAFNYHSIEKKALEAIKNKKEIPFPNSYGDFPPYVSLYDFIDILIKKGITVIKKPLFPQADIPIDQINDKINKMGGQTNHVPHIIVAQYSDEQLKKYIETFFPLFIKEYNKMVEVCFPTIKHSFPFYNNQPFYFIIEFNRFKQNGWTLCYGYKTDNLKENKFEVIINPAKSKFDCKDKSFKTIHFSTIDKLFRADVYSKNRSIASNFNIREADEACVLRDWVYNEIENELKNLIEILK
ncbi:MAG: type I restriction enzyme HsdR N-terminal domain-containing protein [Candidatus Atribacteria bacterium]